MSLKLYVDDLRKCPDGWHLARTVTEAIRVLATQDVSEVSLDHDISHAITMGRADKSIARPYPCAETFEPVAWFLRHCKLLADTRMRVEPFPKITLHTANPIGAKRMEAILADVGLEVTVVLGTPVNGLE